MTAAITLSIYIARQFVAMVVAMLAGAVVPEIALFDFIELLRRSSSKPDATFGLVIEIAGLRLPFVEMQILPFAVLLGGMICFWRLTRSSGADRGAGFRDFGLGIPDRADVVCHGARRARDHGGQPDPRQ